MSIQIFKVGGCVRDRLLREEGFDVPESDIDWVVTGATPEDMLKRGFMPVGSDFPVFLHPQTHEEYALARTERKTARGYHGFTFYASPDVSLEQDLFRRDLTINAMAEDADGRLIDPWGGRDDLKQRLLRHVSDAFIEDPVRICVWHDLPHASQLSPSHRKPWRCAVKWSIKAKRTRWLRNVPGRSFAGGCPKSIPYE